MGVEYLIGSIHWSPLESMGVEDLYGGLMESMGVEELVELVEFVPTYSSTRHHGTSSQIIKKAYRFYCFYP